jgi:hypothetical protein
MAMMGYVHQSPKIDIIKKIKIKKFRTFYIILPVATLGLAIDGEKSGRGT